MPTPTKHYTAAKDVFSYLLMIIMLYIGVISFTAMIWQYINVGFPDTLNQAYGAYDIIRNFISCLVIVWPVLILVSWMIGKDLRKEKEKQNIWVRKWLMYLTLFIASMTIIIDLITLLNSFLSGEVTTRFILKTLVILIVAAFVFGYYLWDLRRDAWKKTTICLIVAIATSVLIIGSIIGGFFLVGSPAHQRTIRMDNQRVSDLQNIQSQVINYWTQKSSVPKVLTDLQDPISGFIVPTDPVTKNAYTYRVKDVHAFELCATFTEASVNEVGAGYTTPSYPSRAGATDVWTHNKGEVCFERTIDPELYKPNSQPVPAPVMIK
ncbi:MAG: DUF5671 domain-containing protein [Candidatus Uhrbacteria bacterium]|nr:DUF5671 domain-containing protein [Candidatus Uhrbacteria bacterium]